MGIPPTEEEWGIWEDEPDWNRAKRVTCPHCGERFVRQSLNQEACWECEGWIEAECGR